MRNVAQPSIPDMKQAIERLLIRHPSVVVAILFGSVATEHVRVDSDLDLAVAASTPLTTQARIDIMGDLAVAFGRPVDLIDLHRVHNPLLHQILTQGRLIYCRNRTQYAEFIRRMVYEEADFMPYYRRILADRRKAWIGT